MASNDIIATVRHMRQALGIPQRDLAIQAGVSLATIQNLEAGRANPSLSTLQQIFEPLGLSICLQSETVDWDILAVLGLPLIPRSRPFGIQRTPGSLERQVRRGAVALHASKAKGREFDAFQALLLALSIHFPRYYQSRFGKSPLVSSFLPSLPDGRILKLMRMALSSLAEYL